MSAIGLGARVTAEDACPAERMAAPHDLVAFCDEQHHSVVGTLALYLGDKQVAAELAQDVFVIVCRDWARIQTLEHPGAWVHRVAMNRATSWFRRRAAERRAHQRVAGRAIDPGPSSDAGSIMRSLVAGLPDDERAVIALRYFADLSVAETAVALGIPEGTVKTRTSRAIRSLRAGSTIDFEDTSDA
jgi:RNA polymerase sigma factor (sigma-70 family)